jgi:hypothetical protein
MDGKELRDRVKAIKAEIAAIQDSETFYRSAKAHTAIQKTALKPDAQRWRQSKGSFRLWQKGTGSG